MEEKLFPVLDVELNVEQKEFMAKKAYVWLKSDDALQMNILAYRDNIIKPDAEAEEKFVNVPDYMIHKVEEDDEWLVGKSIMGEDMSEFFDWYLETFAQK